jgi:hypothetical protein
MQNTVVLDIDGLISYPDFVDKIITPLEEKGTDIRFWSWHPNPELELEKNGLSRYTNGTITYYDWSHLPKTLDELLRKNPNDDEIAHELEGYSLAFRYKTNTDTTTVIKGIKDWHALIRKIDGEHGYIEDPRFKYPPLLGKDNPLLLIESDATKYFGFKPYFTLNRDPFYQRRNLAAASEADYSLLLAPEHPAVWDEVTPKPAAELVTDRIAELVLSWNGEHIVSDLGEEMGIYKEAKIFDPEIDYHARLERR